MSSSNLCDWSFETMCVQDGNHKKPLNSHAMPIFQTSSFTFDSCEMGKKLFAGEMSGHVYSRVGNPTVEALEKNLAALEVERGGESYAVCFATGMAAVMASALSVLQCGDHFIAGNVLYGCTMKLITQTFTRFGIECSTVDTSDVEAVKAAIKPNTRLIYFETPANPSGIISDIAGIAKIAHELENSSNPRILTCVDSTFASPFCQQPLTLGADIVLHSLTKYLGGHGDVVGGVAVTQDKKLADKMRDFRKGSGGCLGPFDAWLVLRGLKTLAVRMTKHNSNAIIVANFLKNHPLVEDVQFAYFPDFPNHDIAARQMFRPVRRKVLRDLSSSSGISISSSSGVDDDGVDVDVDVDADLDDDSKSTSTSSCSKGSSILHSKSSRSSCSSSASSVGDNALFDVVEGTEGGYGATFSFTMRGGYESAKCLLENVHLATLCVSLGNTDTLIEHPGSMTHSAFTEEEMKAAGLTKSLVRISVGLEDPADIVEDLSLSLVAVARMEQKEQEQKQEEVIQKLEEKEGQEAREEGKKNGGKEGKKKKKKERSKEKKRVEKERRESGRSMNEEETKEKQKQKKDKRREKKKERRKKEKEAGKTGMGGEE